MTFDLVYVENVETRMFCLQAEGKIDASYVVDDEEHGTSDDTSLQVSKLLVFHLQQSLREC